MENSEQIKLLLIEDDHDLRGMLTDFLSDEGFEVHAFSEFSNETLPDLTPDIVLLDLMLPGKNGIEISQHLRQHYQGPILIVTAQENELLEVTALNEGATGYLKKPLRPHILLAHINALLRQASHGATTATKTYDLQIGELIINKENYSASLGEEVLSLSSAEFELLSLLVENSGKIISRDFILNNVRGMEYDGLNRSIDMRISTLRKKLKDLKPPYQYIKTVRGKGYIFAKE